MSATSRRRPSGLTLALLAAVGGMCALLACGGDDDHAAFALGDAGAGDDTLGDDDATTPYTGPTQGGTLTRPSTDGASGVQLTPDDGATVDTSCCVVTFVYDPSHYPPPDAGAMSLADAGDAGDAGSLADAGDAAAPAPTAVTLVGDAYPLDDGATLPMTAGAHGVWSVTACIPHGEYLRYRFYLGMVPLDPTLPEGGPTVPLDVCDPSVPTVDDGSGGCFNTFGPVDQCSAVDASTGSLGDE